MANRHKKRAFDFNTCVKKYVLRLYTCAKCTPTCKDLYPLVYITKTFVAENKNKLLPPQTYIIMSTHFYIYIHILTELLSRLPRILYALARGLPRCHAVSRARTTVEKPDFIIHVIKSLAGFYGGNRYAFWKKIPLNIKRVFPT